MQGLGYRHIVAHLEGKWSLPEALRVMQRDTKRYAKRQWTWFRREPVHWVEVGESLETVVAVIKKSIESQGLFAQLS
jgi:tRNA dimethylallyltransferase